MRHTTNPQRKRSRMSSRLVTGRCIALKSKLNGKYLRYSPEKGKILEVSGEDALSPYTRFRAELSKEHDGHVHIRCCYNNKYWVAREVDNEWCLMGDANEPQEDLSDPSCTLLRHEPSSSLHVDNIKLQHGSLKRSVYVLANADDPTKNTLRAGSLLLGNKDKPDEDAYMFSVIDLQMLLPKHVCFTNATGTYLKAYLQHGNNFLQFGSDEIADPLVRNIIHTNSDGTIRIFSTHFGKFWRATPGWICADSADTTASDIGTVFRVISLEDGGKCALQNLGNNNYCKRFTYQGLTSCLSAVVSTITMEAQLVLHETVLSRRIYGVQYRLNDVNITGLKPRTFYSRTISNTTDRPHKSKATVAYYVTTEKRWDSSVSWKLAGVKTSITAGVPGIAEALVEISSEFTGSYSWAETKSETEHYSNEEEVEVPAHTEVTVRVLATQGTCDVPFSYFQEDLLTTGEKVVTRMDDGIFRGVNSFGFKTEVSEKKI